MFCIQVWWVTLFALDALAVAAQSLVASSLGTGDVPRARGAADRCLKWALAAGTAVGVGKFLFYACMGNSIDGVFFKQGFTRRDRRYRGCSPTTHR